VFVHVLDWPDPQLALPSLGAPVRAAYAMPGKAPVRFQETAAGVTLTLPAARANDPDRVIVLVTGGGSGR
jgi:hypothetical protein